jgi:hypothetical protein
VGLGNEELGGELDFRRWRAESYGRGAEEEGAALRRIRGLAEEPCRRWTVEVLDVGDAA